MCHRAAVLSAVGVTAFAALTTAVGMASAAPPQFLIVDLVTGLTFVGAGLAAAWLRPTSPAGLLLLASGGLWFVGSYAPTGRPVMTELGFAFEGYYDLTLAVLLLLLSTPGRGLQPRVLIGALAATMAVRSVARLILPDPASAFPECTECPTNPFAIAPSWWLFEAVEIVTSLVMTALFVTVALVAARRLLSAGPAVRRTRRPILVAGSLAMAGAAYRSFGYAWSTATGAPILDLPEPANEIFEWSIFALRCLVPLAFLVGVLRARGLAGPLAPLATRLAGSADTTTTGDAVRSALGDSSASLYLAGGDGSWLSEAGATVATPEADDLVAVTLIGSQEAPVGAITHDRSLLDHPELLGGVVTVLRLALENERLERELREQLAEVRDSRSRIVAATEEERRRIERDLHDGAQQRLVAATLALQQTRAAADAGPGSTELRRSLDALADELIGAIRELRELARGIHPAILEHEGLGAAVAGLARRASIPVDVRVDLDGRLPHVVESTAYFTIAEALTNTQRYAQASHAQVHVAAVDRRLEVEVVDDGIGGADPTHGSGLRGLADRVRALGGDLLVDSRAGHGTAVRATIPLP